MSEVQQIERTWMKHRDRPGGVWHLAAFKDTSGGRFMVTSCRGDQLYGTMGPIVQRFLELPKSAKCVRCTQLWIESQNTQ